MKPSGKKRDLFWNSKLPEPRGFCTRDPSLAFQPLTLRFMTRTLPRTSYPAAPTPVSMQLPSNPRSGWGGGAAPPVTATFMPRTEPQNLRWRLSFCCLCLPAPEPPEARLSPWK